MQIINLFQEDDEILSSQRVLRFEDSLFHIFGIEQNSNFSDITDSIDFISSYFGGLLFIDLRPE